MPKYICAFYPKKSAIANGVTALAICVESKNAKLAEMKAIMALEESFPDTTDSFFKPKISEFIMGDSGRPAVDTFDTEWIKDYEWNDETKKFDSIPRTVTGNDAQLDEFDPFSNTSVIADLPIAERVAYIIMYGATPDNIDTEHLSNAVDMVSDNEAPEEIQSIIAGLTAVPAIKQMYPSKLAVLIETMRAQMPPYDNVEDVKKFAEKWVVKPTEREQKIEAHSGIQRTYETLDLEVALHIMGVNPDHAKASDIRNAKYIIETRDSAWRTWITSLRAIPGILDIPRSELWELMAEGHKDLKLLNDADARRDYIISKLSGHPLLPDYQPDATNAENLGSGKYSSESEKTEAANTTIIPPAIDAKPAINTAQTDTAQVATASKSQLSAPEILHIKSVVESDDFKQRAVALEKGLSDKSTEELENLHIWKRVQSTDPRYTKPLEGTGFIGTSINAEYMFMRATEIFGPVGTGWGYEIIEDRMLNGAPLSEAIYENNTFVRSILLRDADGSLLYEQNHVLRIKFWYVVEGDIRGELEAYGSTPYLYKSKRGITTDGETHKKSLTDSIKKALSMLGFSADVWLGWHDMPEYLADNAIEYSIKNASDKAEDTVRLRKELDDKFSQNTDTMRTSVTANEVTKIASSLNRTIGVHLKNAKAVNDTEHARYLETRLRRLEEIKSECLTKFEEVNA